jgi:ankyrin repeat protein
MMLIRNVAIFFSVVTFSVISSAPALGQGQRSSVPIIQAMYDGDLEKARTLLRGGASLNVIDNYGNTPLDEAIRDGYSDFAAELLDSGADPRFATQSRGTPLQFAAANCDLKIAAKLLKLGIPVDAPDPRGVTPLMVAPSQRCTDGVMVHLLLEAGANPNATSKDGYSPLISAARAGDSKAVSLLLRAGADPRAKDIYGHTAQSDSCDRGEKGHAEVCDQISRALANASSRPAP